MMFNTHLAFKPAIPFIDMYPKEMKTDAHKDEHKDWTQMFTAAFVTLTTKWK